MQVNVWFNACKIVQSPGKGAEETGICSRDSEKAGARLLSRCSCCSLTTGKEPVEFINKHKPPEPDTVRGAVSCNACDAAQRNWVLSCLGLINCLPGGRCWWATSPWDKRQAGGWFGQTYSSLWEE